MVMSICGDGKKRKKREGNYLIFTHFFASSSPRVFLPVLFVR